MTATMLNVTKISLFAALLTGVAWLWAGPEEAALWGGGGVEMEAEEGRDSVPVGAKSVNEQQQKKGRIEYLQNIDGKLLSTSYWQGAFAVVEFYDSKSKGLLKTINVREENPCLTIGLSVDSYEGSESNDVVYLRSAEGLPKHQIKSYLPAYLYDEIPDEWLFDGGVTMCMPSSNWQGLQSYALVYYLMEWAPREERQFMGNYGVTTVAVYDSLGKEVYRRQFDGLLSDAVISENGAFLAITYSFYPENAHDEASRFQNCAEIIYLPEDRSVWKDCTPQHYEEYHFKSYPKNALIGAKILKGSNDYLSFILDADKGVLFSKALSNKDEVRQILGFRAGKSLHYTDVKGKQELSVDETFKNQNLLEQ